MASALDSYNREIIATSCRFCGVVDRRCKGQSTGHSPQMSHRVRQEDAGYRWNKQTRVLEKLDAPDEEDNDQRRGQEEGDVEVRADRCA